MKKPITQEMKDYVSYTESELISTEYKNYRDLLEFRCSCGEIYLKEYRNFKRAKNKSCQSCSEKAIRDSYRHPYSKVFEYIETKGCELLSKEYKNNEQLLKIRCGCGQTFRKTYAKFVGRDETRCADCTNLLKREAHSFSIEEVKEMLRKDGNVLVSREYVNMKNPLNIRCSCGNQFTTSLEVYGRGKKRCGPCSGVTSRNELQVIEELEKNPEIISFEEEYSYADCGNIFPYPFDFLVVTSAGNYFLIEVDGEQHFRPIDFFGGEVAYEKQVARDKTKTKYCLQNNIPLLRIPYFEIDSAGHLIKEFIKTIPSQA